MNCTARLLYYLQPCIILGTGSFSTRKDYRNTVMGRFPGDTGGMGSPQTPNPQSTPSWGGMSPLAGTTHAACSTVSPAAEFNARGPSVTMRTPPRSFECPCICANERAKMSQIAGTVLMLFQATDTLPNYKSYGTACRITAFEKTGDLLRSADCNQSRTDVEVHFQPYTAGLLNIRTQYERIVRRQF